VFAKQVFMVMFGSSNLLDLLYLITFILTHNKITLSWNPSDYDQTSDYDIFANQVLLVLRKYSDLVIVMCCGHCI
jgi:hypothetical protein